MLNTALLGAGRIGQVHARSIAAHRDSQLVAVADVVANAARKLAAEYGVQARSVDDILADPTIGAVLIATSTDTHAALIERASSAGKAVLCEKPVDLSLEQCLDVTVEWDLAGFAKQNCVPGFGSDTLSTADDLSEEGVTKVGNDDADGVRAASHERSCDDIRDVAELAGSLEDALACLGRYASVRIATEHERNRRLRYARPLRNVVSRDALESRLFHSQNLRSPSVTRPKHRSRETTRSHAAPQLRFCRRPSSGDCPELQRTCSQETGER